MLSVFPACCCAWSGAWGWICWACKRRSILIQAAEMTRRETTPPLLLNAVQNLMFVTDKRAKSGPIVQILDTWGRRTERRIGPSLLLSNPKAKQCPKRTQWQRMTCEVDTGECPDELPEERETRKTEARQLNRLRDLLSRESRAEAWTVGEWTRRDASPTEPRCWRRPVERSKRRLWNMEVNCSKFQSGHPEMVDKAATLRASSRSSRRGQLAGCTV